MYPFLIPFIDLTSLNDTDTPDTINALCSKATTPYGNVAAVCVYPPFVQQAAQLLQGSSIKVATVANFPHALSPLPEVLQEIEQSIENGANEIDVVFPYPAYLQQQSADSAAAFIAACKEKCGEYIRLKVILETGALRSLDLIAEATQLSMRAGADFIKTSTGKITPGATLEAAECILQQIQQSSVDLQRPIGLKVAGGIQHPDQALAYWMLAKKIRGENQITPHIFRIGASRLVDQLLASVA